MGGIRIGLLNVSLERHYVRPCTFDVTLERNYFGLCGRECFLCYYGGILVSDY